VSTFGLNSEIHFMSTKAFLHQRLSVYAGRDFDPCVDDDVSEVLRNKFNIHLPQRPSFDESLESATSDHEVISLILQYRKLG